MDVCPCTGGRFLFPALCQRELLRHEIECVIVIYAEANCCKGGNKR